MKGIQQRFRTSHKSWSQKDRNEVENFFLSNPFFSKFYQSKKFDKISRLCLYRKLQPSEHMILQNNNRAEAILLLAGHIVIKKRQRSRVITKQRLSVFDSQTLPQVSQRISRVNSKRNSHPIQQQQVILAEMKQFNQTIVLNSQCSVHCISKIPSQIIFIPCALYYKLRQQAQTQRITKIQLVLERFFNRLTHKDIYDMSRSSCCLFKEFKMNSYIYRASSKPQQVFILVQGVVKLQKPGFSQKTLQQTIVVNAGMMFGDSDLRMEERTRNAIACSAHVEVLSIAKSQYLKYVTKTSPDSKMILFQHMDLQLPRVFSNRVVDCVPHTARNTNNNSPTTGIKLFPSIQKFKRFRVNTQRHQTKLNEIEQRRQYELIKNSHMMVDIRSKVKSGFKMRTFSPKQKEEEVARGIKRQRSKVKVLKQLNIYN